MNLAELPYLHLIIQTYCLGVFKQKFYEFYAG